MRIASNEELANKIFKPKGPNSSLDEFKDLKTQICSHNDMKTHSARIKKKHWYEFNDSEPKLLANVMDEQRKPRGKTGCLKSPTNESKRKQP